MIDLTNIFCAAEDSHKALDHIREASKIIDDLEDELVEGMDLVALREISARLADCQAFMSALSVQRMTIVLKH